MQAGTPDGQLAKQQPLMQVSLAAASQSASPLGHSGLAAGAHGRRRTPLSDPGVPASLGGGCHTAPVGLNEAAEAGLTAGAWVLAHVRHARNAQGAVARARCRHP